MTRLKTPPLLRGTWFPKVFLHRFAQNSAPPFGNRQLRGRPLAYRLFSLGRIPARQHSISRDATEEFVGIELFVPDFEGERKGSTKPTMRAQIAGTARVVLDQLRFETIFWTTNYSRHPINTSYTFS
jgi:hypothetical protein